MKHFIASRPCVTVVDDKAVHGAGGAGGEHAGLSFMSGGRTLPQTQCRPGALRPPKKKQAVTSTQWTSVRYCLESGRRLFARERRVCHVAYFCRKKA